MLGLPAPWRRRRVSASAAAAGSRPDDDGFTVVELIVALALMAIVMAGLAPALDSALQAASTANRRTAANGLATAAIEQMRAVAYDTVGYQHGSPALAACTPTGNPQSPFYPYASQTPVDLGAGTSGLPPWGYTMNDTPNSVVFTVQSCVYWMNAAGATSGSKSYKQSVVSVTWSDSAGPHGIVDVSAVYPTNSQAVTQPSQPVTNTLLNPPSTVSVTPDPASGVIDVSWTAASPTPTDYLVLYSATDDFSNWSTLMVSPPVYGQSYQATGLTPGVTYYFQVASQNSQGISPLAAGGSPATAPGSNGGGCNVSSISLNPANGTVYTGLPNNNATPQTPGALLSPYTGIGVTVNASSQCGGPGISVKVAGPSGYSGWVGGVQNAPLTQAVSGSFTGTFGSCSGPDASHQWSPGTYTFTVYIGGSPTGSGNSVVQGSSALTGVTSTNVKTSC